MQLFAETMPARVRRSHDLEEEMEEEMCWKFGTGRVGERGWRCFMRASKWPDGK